MGDYLRCINKFQHGRKKKQKIAVPLGFIASWVLNYLNISACTTIPTRNKCAHWFSTVALVAAARHDFSFTLASWKCKFIALCRLHFFVWLVGAIAGVPLRMEQIDECTSHCAKPNLTWQPVLCDNFTSLLWFDCLLFFDWNSRTLPTLKFNMANAIGKDGRAELASWKFWGYLSGEGKVKCVIGIIL